MSCNWDLLRNFRKSENLIKLQILLVTSLELRLSMNIDLVELLGISIGQQEHFLQRIVKGTIHKFWLCYHFGYR